MVKTREDVRRTRQQTWWQPEPRTGRQSRWEPESPSGEYTGWQAYRYPGQQSQWGPEPDTGYGAAREQDPASAPYAVRPKFSMGAHVRRTPYARPGGPAPLGATRLVGTADAPERTARTARVPYQQGYTPDGSYASLQSQAFDDRNDDRIDDRYDDGYDDADDDADDPADEEERDDDLDRFGTFGHQATAARARPQFGRPPAARTHRRAARQAPLTGATRFRRAMSKRTVWIIGAGLAVLFTSLLGIGSQMLVHANANPVTDASKLTQASDAPTGFGPATQATNTQAADTQAAQGTDTASATPAATAPTAPTTTTAPATPKATATPKPKPSPTTTPAAAPAAPPTTTASGPNTGTNYNTVGQPCHSTNFWAAKISQWAIPPDCFATIYTPNPANYPKVPSRFGVCNWWPQVLHPSNTDILSNSKYRRGSTPVPGAAIFFGPNVQGASSDGHFAQVVAVQPGSPWILITEMNFAWRGAGFGKVDYRYIKVGAGVTFIYTN